MVKPGRGSGRTGRLARAAACTGLVHSRSRTGVTAYLASRPALMKSIVLVQVCAWQWACHGSACDEFERGTVDWHVTPTLGESGGTAAPVGEDCEEWCLERAHPAVAPTRVDSCYFDRNSLDGSVVIRCTGWGYRECG